MRTPKGSSVLILYRLLTLFTLMTLLTLLTRPARQCNDMKSYAGQYEQSRRIPIFGREEGATAETAAQLLITEPCPPMTHGRRDTRLATLPSRPSTAPTLAGPASLDPPEIEHRSLSLASPTLPEPVSRLSWPSWPSWLVLSCSALTCTWHGAAGYNAAQQVTLHEVSVLTFNVTSGTCPTMMGPNLLQIGVEMRIDIM